MKHAEMREKFRAILGGEQCISPASVYDPMSARVAESVGCEAIAVAGSTAANCVLAAPDLVLLTLTELAEQMRRITRVCGLPLLVDADHGYGNALNVMRTVQELEHAGVAALTIEDTLLPLSFGQPKSEMRLIPLEEGLGKMRAAVAARSDPSLVIVARTSALHIEGTEGAVKRVRAYAQAGVDAIFLHGLDNLAQMEAIHAVAGLPIMLGAARNTLTREDLRSRGARILLEGQLPMAAAIKALQEAYSHLHKHGPAGIKNVAAPADVNKLINDAVHERWIKDFMN